MSNISNVRIAKGGKLLADRFVYDEDAGKGHTEHDVDLTDSAIYFTHKDCKVEKDATLRDVLLLIDSMDKYQTLSGLFTGGPCLKEIVDEGLNREPSGKNTLNEIILSWWPAFRDDFYNKGRDVFETHVSVHGKKDGDDITYSTSFTPICDMIDCRLILDTKFDIEDEREQSIQGRLEFLEENPNEPYYPVVHKSHKNYTLFDILKGLFWEFSFYGTPKKRDEQVKKIKEQYDRIKNGEEELHSWEDIKDLLEGDEE